MWYKTMDLDDAVARGCKDPDVLYMTEDKHCDTDYMMGVFECNLAGVPIRLLGSDGGEPEDQTLCRNWSWVSEELQKAYDLGFATGQLT